MATSTDRIHRDILGKARAEYGGQIVSPPVRQLLEQYGAGFSRQNLFHMIRFAEGWRDQNQIRVLGQHRRTAIVLYLTETKTGEMRALQPRELYRSQQYGTAIYRSELALRLKELGHEVEQGKSCQPEISGYTPKYLEACIP